MEHPVYFIAGGFGLLRDNFLLIADLDELVQVDAETMNQHRVSVANVTSHRRPQVLEADWLRVVHGLG